MWRNLRHSLAGGAVVAQNLILLRSHSRFNEFTEAEICIIKYFLSHIYFLSFLLYDSIFYKNKKSVFTEIKGSKTLINLGIKCILGKLWQESCHSRWFWETERAEKLRKRSKSDLICVFFLLACFLLILKCFIVSTVRSAWFISQTC